MIIKGIPQIHVGHYAECSIGAGLRMNSGLKYNKIGRQGPCQIIVGDAAELLIGEQLGISSSAIICHHKIHIGDRVLIGGNVVIYDTDFHSLDPISRSDRDSDEAERLYKPVIIGSDVFIGAHSTILKGVTIGDGAIVGACSVVTKNIPAGEIWAGNPAKFIRRQGPSHAIRVA